MRFIRFFYCFVFCLFLFSNEIVASDTLRYQVSLPNKVHHEAEIKLTIDWDKNQPLIFEMAQSSPGRYAVHNFAKNIYNLKATDSAGNAIPLTRTDINQWQITDAKGIINLSYTLWGNTADGTYAGINANQAMLNIPASFIYIPALKLNPITVNFHLPAGWQVATQMPNLTDNRCFAPNLDYFMDSPVLLAKMDILSWQETSQDKIINFRLAIHHRGDSAYLNDYVNWIKSIVKLQKEIFGEYPEFDYDTYTFIANYAPYARGDGMEHRNSTILSSRRSIFHSGRRLIGTVSHEFLHAWNVERLRPVSLEPFLYDRSNMSPALWFAEGFTSYYTDLVLCRAGIIDQKQYTDELQSMVNTVINSPGHHFHGPVAMSQMAPFVDAAAHADATCFYNTYISYYTYGAAIGLALDLSLRVYFNSSLDAYMKLLWQNFGRNEIPYTLQDLENILAHISEERFARDFFSQYIYQSNLPDFSVLLGQVGIEVSPSFDNQLYLANFRLPINSDGIFIGQYTVKGSPLYEAGLEKGDLITQINQNKVSTHDQLEDILRQITPGDSLAITYRQLGIIKSGYVVPEKSNNLSLKLNPTSENHQKILNNWLSDD